MFIIFFTIATIVLSITSVLMIFTKPDNYSDRLAVLIPLAFSLSIIILVGMGGWQLMTLI